MRLGTVIIALLFPAIALAQQLPQAQRPVTPEMQALIQENRAVRAEAQVIELNAQLAELKAQYDAATKDKAGKQPGEQPPGQPADGGGKVKP